MITEKEQVEFAKTPYTQKEIDDYNADQNPDYLLFCTNEDGKKVMIGSDFYCFDCNKEMNQ